MMDIGSILLIVSIFILTIIFIIQPFFNKKNENFDAINSVMDQSELDHQYSSLLAEKERLLNTLQELDADHDLGKIPEEDYPNQRAFLIAAGADVLKELDELDERLGINKEDGSVENNGSLLDEMPPASNDLPDLIEDLVIARRQLREEKSAGFCPKCGKVIQKSDVFCPRCGIKVSG